MKTKNFQKMKIFLSSKTLSSTFDGGVQIFVNNNRKKIKGQKENS